MEFFDDSLLIAINRLFFNLLNLGAEHFLIILLIFKNVRNHAPEISPIARFFFLKVPTITAQVVLSTGVLLLFFAAATVQVVSCPGEARIVWDR